MNNEDQKPKWCEFWLRIYPGIYKVLEAYENKQWPTGIYCEIVPVIEAAPRACRNRQATR